MASALPLKGKDGIYRVNVVGNSGVGKTTMSRELAAILGVPCVETDKVQWNPGWVSTPKDEFRARMQKIIDDNPGGWVIDGSYDSLGGVVRGGATDIIWLDPPFWRYFPRLFWRTIGRWLGFTPLCSPGCRETFVSIFFSKDSILLWSLTHHLPTRRKVQEWMKTTDLTSTKFVHIRSNAQLRKFYEDVRKMVRQE